MVIALAAKTKPRKKHPKTVWDAFRFPIISDRKPTTGCNIELGAKPDEITKRVRAEIARRTKKLVRARSKYPPTTITVGRGRNKREKRNPDFTPAMAAKLHKLAFTAEQVRAEIEAQ